MSRINYEYIKSGNEIPLLIKLLRYYGKSIKNPKKILIISSNLIGDFVVSCDAIHSFVKKTKAEIDIVVPKNIKPLAESLKGIRKVFIANSIANRKIEQYDSSEIPKETYDLVIVMRISSDSYSLIKKIKFKSLKTYLFPWIKFLSLSFLAMFTKKSPSWHKLQFDILGLKEFFYKFEDVFNIQNSDYSKFSNLEDNKKNIIIHTGTGWDIKLWNNNSWIELLNKINLEGKYRFIFIGGDNKEEKDYNYISRKLNFKIYSLIKKINLRELSALMKKSDYFIGIDSGPRNLAHVVGLPSVSLLGQGPKQYMPFNKNDIVIDKSNCFCSGLFCYKKKTCMQKISVNDVFFGFLRLVNSKRL